MGALEDSLRSISERVKSHSSSMVTEEAVKTAVVLPFFHALGYDIFDPFEVIPEFTADAVGKKGEKVDYAIKTGEEIGILVECKPVTTELDRKHLSQLFRYFTVTKAKFAILTNGRTFNFYTDLEEPNKLDARPFLIFDVTDLNPSTIAELRKFEKAGFNVDTILATAERLKYTSGVKRVISGLMDNPSDDFIRLVAGSVYEGRITAQVKDMLSGVVKTAFREVIMENVKNRLTNALADTESVNQEIENPAEDEPEIVTTDDEREGYMIAKAIARGAIPSNRIFMRDAKSYCAILIDNNNRKPLLRLHFNRATKYIGLFDGETEERVLIESLDQIYDHSDRILATARKYAGD